jgi:MFS family permease
MKNNTESISFLKLIGLSELADQGSKTILAFWLIISMSFFLFADQNLIAPNLKNIAHSIGLYSQGDIDTYLGGVIPVCFFILGGAVSISMGYLTQRFSRKNLLIACVLLGEIPCFLTAFSTSYKEFLIYRTLCGFGLGGVFPILFSLVGDYFSNKSRVTATAFVSLAMGLGVGIGQMVGGILGEADPINGWRNSFIYLSTPSFFIILIYGIFCVEPVRGAKDEYSELSHKLSLNDIKAVFAKKTNVAIFLQGIPGCVPWGVFFVYLVDYYETIYKLNKAAAAGYVTLSGMGILLGILIGGIVGQKLYDRNKFFQPLFSMAAILIGVIPTYILIHSFEMVNSSLFLWLNFLTGIILSLPMSNIRSILINVNPPRTRSAAFSLYNLTDDLGKGLGPAIGAIFLSLIPDRTMALTISISFWIPCALLWIPIVLNFENDEKKMKEELRLEQ